MKIVKIIQWDMGHRVMNHRSVCKGLHGHRYKAEICVEGDIVNETGASEEGMVVDFADIKRIANSFIHDKLDHAFMVWEKDIELLNFFENSEGHKPVIVPFTSTAENVAAYIFNELDGQFNDAFGTGLRLHSVKLWETPTSCAIFGREDI
ncbi:MAG: 6-carboxytetrahydropterin synthase [Candidatus Marinimicrobia bacterium]|nr:6-carboxytetrahydropterin synthase [Candidatus Neomarinimicrobiota bacterium]|tara:strand:+ start:247 stop:696 length:450 start_codon:yes stop_codon:yes gene_type:complete